MVNEKHILPEVEIVAELESESNSEQKAQNQEYILSNLDKYIVDIHGNFFHIDEEMMVNEDERFYVGQDAVEDHNKIKERIVEMIINEKDSWEINDEGNYVRRDCNKRTMSSNGFSSEQNEEIKKVLEGENGSQVTQQQRDFFMLVVPTSSSIPSFHHHTQFIDSRSVNDRSIDTQLTISRNPVSWLIINNEDQDSVQRIRERDSVQRELEALDEDLDITRVQQTLQYLSMHEPEILPLD